MACYPILKVCQHEEARLDYAFNFTHEFAHKWQPGIPYADGALVRPSKIVTGFEYEATEGVSGETEPDWPTTLGQSVTDGSVTWTAKAITTSSLRHRIASVVWTAATNLTLDGQVETDTAGLQEIRIWASGGVAGAKYANTFELTTDQGAVYAGKLIVSVE